MVTAIDRWPLYRVAVIAGSTVYSILSNSLYNNYTYILKCDSYHTSSSVKPRSSHLATLN